MKRRKRFKSNKAIAIVSIVLVIFTVLGINLLINPKEESIVEQYDPVELEMERVDHTSTSESTSIIEKK